MASRFCAGGFIFMPACLAACLPRWGGCNHHLLASRKKHTADPILSRDSFKYHLVLNQRPSAISPTRRAFPLARMVDEVIWLMQWLRNGRCSPNGAKL